MSKGSKKQGRGETRAGRETAARIMTAASSLFTRNGFSATSVSMICAEAEVTATSLYHLFGNKEGLLRAVLADVGETWVAEQRALQESARVEGDETTALLESHLDMLKVQLAKRPSILRLLYMLSLERGRGDVVSLAIVRTARKSLIEDWSDVLVTVRPDLPAQVVRDRAELILAILDGAFFAGELDPDVNAARRLVDGIKLLTRA